jgi:hypothetical protein
MRAWSPMVGLLLAALPVTAQTRSPEAEALFAEARQLMEAGNHGAACPKLALSNQLDPAPGTLLNLAECLLALGKTATAWSTLRDAKSLAERGGDQPRADLAERRIRALEPRLAHVVVEVPTAHRIPGLAIKRGSDLVPDAMWGTSVPVDPGRITVEATAPGHRSVRLVVEPKEGAREIVTVPLLARLPARAAEPTPVAQPSSQPVTKDANTGSTQRILGGTFLGVGVVAVGVGAYLGLRARSDWRDAKDQCSVGTTGCSDAAIQGADDAGKKADISTVLFIAGGAFATGGLALYLTAPSSRETASLGFQPLPGGGHAAYSTSF